MNPNNDAATAPAASPQKPKLALALATVLGVGYLPRAPGTFGSLIGIITAILSAIFFVRPSSFRELFSGNPLADSVFAPNSFLLFGSDVHNVSMIFPVIAAVGVLVVLVAIGVWSSGRTAAFAGLKDPQFVVIDEVAGQHLTLLLPLIPIALPTLTAHFDFPLYAIFFALSLLNWKYLLAGFVLFRLFDIVKPFPCRQLEKLPGGWGIMADDWMAGVYAAIFLRLALHFGLL